MGLESSIIRYAPDAALAAKFLDGTSQLPKTERDFTDLLNSARKCRAAMTKLKAEDKAAYKDIYHEAWDRIIKVRDNIRLENNELLQSTLLAALKYVAGEFLYLHIQDITNSLYKNNVALQHIDPNDFVEAFVHGSGISDRKPALHCVIDGFPTGSGNPISYFFVAAKNFMYDILRKHGKMLNFTSSGDETVTQDQRPLWLTNLLAASPYELISGKEASDAVIPAILNIAPLTPRSRKYLSLLIERGPELSTEDSAAFLNVQDTSAAVFKSLLLKQLRLAFLAQGVTSSAQLTR
jgi:hypothetical protein